jgi:hypothetical protein
MKKFSAKGQKWLKCIHIFFASLWVGGAVTINLMNFTLKAADGMQLYGINLAMKFVDDFIIIPGALGSLITGIVYAVFTNWGWFKHNWIIVKLVINIFGVIFGTFWLGPWLNLLPKLSKIQGMDALTNTVYIHNQNMLFVWGPFQTVTIIFALFISVLKPWKKKTKSRPFK